MNLLRLPGRAHVEGRWLRRVACSLVGFTPMACNAEGLGCERLHLALDSQLTPAIVDRQWASGETQSGSPAVLELRGCAGELFDKLVLQAPLARLDSVALRGAPWPTYLVSVDLTAPAGSYNGPLTMAVQVSQHRLQWVEAKRRGADPEPIRLASTGKAAWKRFLVNGADDLLSVSCHHEGDGFVVVYRRFRATRQGWTARVRSEPGFWESDRDFPETRRFR